MATLPVEMFFIPSHRGQTSRLNQFADSSTCQHSSSSTRQLTCWSAGSSPCQRTGLWQSDIDVLLSSWLLRQFDKLQTCLLVEMSTRQENIQCQTASQLPSNRDHGVRVSQLFRMLGEPFTASFAVLMWVVAAPAAPRFLVHVPYRQPSPTVFYQLLFIFGLLLFHYYMVSFGSTLNCTIR